jgi:hypothetical protein
MANNNVIGTNSWSTPNNAMTSDNAYATVATKGITQYLSATNFGFSIPSPSGIAGIKLDVERSTSGSSDVALLDAWSTGLTKTVSAGTNRCLLVTYCQENGIDSRDITAMTYGGRSMTQVVQTTAGVSGGFMARIEVWMLLESEIALAGSTTIVPTYGSYTPLEYCEVFSSAVFQHVDQLSPVYSQQTGGAQATTDPHQLGTAFSTLAGSMAIHLVTCGNRDASNPSANNNTTSYPAPTGYTEGTDYYFANNSAAPTTGACYQTCHKAIASAGSEQPSCDFNGTVNRFAMIGFTLQRAREQDYSVKLIKGGSIGGTDQAGTGSWPTSDAYASYGNATDLWGRTWTTADINASTFGAAIAARVQNGTVRVDHMRITVYYYSTLPIELLDFRATQDGQVVRLEWATASEQNNDHFVVQRSRDGVVFEDVERVPGAGNSLNTLYYTTSDKQAVSGMNYYRLVQVDTDGTAVSSDIVAIDVRRTDLLVFPNPTDGTITLFDVVLGRDQVAVYGDDMRLIRTHVGAGSDPAIHLDDLPDGTYTIMVRSGENVRTSRVVKVSMRK